jgi:carboxylesterase
MGIESIFLEGNKKHAIILFHGFTGSPEEMEEVGKNLNKLGYTIFIPLLPGHGTHWKALNKIKCGHYISFVENIFKAVQNKYKDVSLIGFSFGGTLALYLSEKFNVKSQILINSMAITGSSLIIGKLVSRVISFVPSLPDVHKKVDKLPFSYKVYPLKALGSVANFINLTKKDFNKISIKTMLIYSIRDHAVSYKNSLLIYNAVSSTEKCLVPLYNSYHMAILDYDKEEIFKKIYDFFKF